MTSLFRAIDIFKTNFTFTIDKERGYSTVLGSILSISSAIVFVALFIILGKDFLYKENPRTATSVLIANRIEKVNLRDLNLTIAISLKKNINNLYLIDLDGKFFWSDYTYSHKYYNQTDESYKTNYTSIRLKPCNNLTYQPSMNFSSEFYCIEFTSDVYIGEEENQTYNVKYALYNCEKKYPMFFPGVKCNSLDDLMQLFKEESVIGYMLNIYYPVLYIDPRDKVNPAKVNYELLSFPFDFNLQRSDTLNFHKTVVNEDKGWWFEDNSNQTYWTVESKDYTFNYKTNADLNKNEASSKLYEFNLFVSLKNNYFTKSFMKIQDVLAVVATILKILMIIFEFLCMLLNTSLIRYFIFTKLFCTLRSNDSSNNISAYFNNNVSRVNLINVSKSKDVSPITLLGSKVTPLNLSKHIQFSTVRNYNKCFALRYAFGSCAFRASDKPYLIKFHQGQKVVREKIDLENYLKMIYDVIILQKSIFNEAQCHCLHYLKRVNLFNIQEMESYFNLNKGNCGGALQKYAGYFANQIERNDIEKARDKFILDKLDESFKAKLLLNKVN